MKSISGSCSLEVKTSAIIFLSAVFISAVNLIGCAPSPVFIKSDFEDRNIKSIAIMPVIDKRDVSDNPKQQESDLPKIEELLANKMIEKHYDVLSSAKVKEALNDESIKNVPPENLCSELKVDGILFSELYEYSDDFYIKHSLNMHFNVYDAQGDSLWINDVDDSERPFLEAIGSSLGWAIGVAVDKKVESKNKIPIILAGVAAGQLVYIIVDAVSDETSQSIDRVFSSLPSSKGIMK
jgi:hypothetical protein